jgi:RNA-directed DNA polymerase
LRSRGIDLRGCWLDGDHCVEDVRRRLTGPHGRWARPTADGIELFNIAKVPVTRHRYRGNKIPNRATLPNHA